MKHNRRRKEKKKDIVRWIKRRMNVRLSSTLISFCQRGFKPFMKFELKNLDLIENKNLKLKKFNRFNFNS